MHGHASIAEPTSASCAQVELGSHVAVMAEDNRGYWIAEVAELFEDELVRFLLPLPMGCFCCLSVVSVMCIVLSGGVDLLTEYALQCSIADCISSLGFLDWPIFGWRHFL